MLILPIVALLASSSAIAQHVLFEDDFTNGVGAWTPQAPWHWAPANDPCTSLSNPPASYGAMARAGDPNCFYSYSFGPDLQVAQGVLIPIDAVNPRLEFDSYLDMSGFDFGQVYLQVNGSGWQSVGGLPPVWASWTTVSLDLSPWRGQIVSIGFEFVAYHSGVTYGLGWLVDNVRILTDGTSQNYCVAAANSVSPTGATIGYSGSLDLSHNNFALTLQNGPPGQFGLFFYGPFQGQTPVAQGFLCIQPDALGYRRLFPAVHTDVNGNASRIIDFPALTGSHTVMPGIQVNFQCWYRDVVGGFSVSNFSDALSITFSP